MNDKPALEVGPPRARVGQSRLLIDEPIANSIGNALKNLQLR